MPTPTLSRRQLLQGKAPRLLFQPEKGPAGDVLITIFLRGAMDGVYTVPPYADPAYRHDRPTLSLPEPGKPGGALDLDGFYGLHPDLAPMKELFQAQRLAIVQEVEDGLREVRVAAERLRLAETQGRLAADAAASARRSYEAGVASSLDVIDANDRLYQADVQLASARARTAQARIALDRAIGRGP